MAKMNTLVRPENQREGEPVAGTVSQVAGDPCDASQSLYRGKLAAAAGLIALAAGIAYANSFEGVFTFDDGPSIQDNPTIRQVWPPGAPLSPPSRGETVSGRPLLNFSLAVNYVLGKLSPWGYHAVNLAIHILAALLLFGILRRTFESRRLKDALGKASLRLALAISLLWALHPLQTESVTYVVQRAESMVGLFYLATLYCVIRGAASSRSAWWNLLALLACLAGMATKEVMVTAPLVVLLYDWQFLAESFKEAMRRRWALYLGLAATWGLLVCLVASTSLIHQKPDIDRPDWWSYARTQPEVILHYLRLSFWPHPLCLDYGWPIADSWRQIIPGVVVVGVLLAATLWAFVRRSAWAFLGVWFFLILAPTSSVLPLKDLAFEHRMYLPLAAVVTAAVLAGHAACRRLTKRGLAAGVIGVCLLAAASATLGYLTFQRNRDYGSELAIWQDATIKATENPRAHCNLGSALSNAGRLDEAVAHCRKALELKPNYAKAHNNLGVALHASGRFGEAAVHYTNALEGEPEYAKAHYNLGTTFIALRRFDEAITHFQSALATVPHFVKAHNNLGNAMNALGRFEEAVTHYQNALAISPDFVEAHYNLGIVLNSLQRFDEAVPHWRKAVELEPNQAAILNWLAWVLATHPDASLRNGAEATEYARRACDLLGNGDAAALDTLAAAYAESGRFSEAVQTAQQALALATAQNNAPLAGTIESRIRLYQSGTAYREVPPQREKNSAR